MARKQSFKKFVEENIIGVDKLVKHKDGTYSFKRGFFYRHEMDDEKFGRQISNSLTKEGIEFRLIKTFEDWNAWPKDSWFVAVFEILNY